MRILPEWAVQPNHRSVGNGMVRTASPLPSTPPPLFDLFLLLCTTAKWARPVGARTAPQVVILRRREQSFYLAVRTAHLGDFAVLQDPRRAQTVPLVNTHRRPGAPRARCAPRESGRVPGQVRARPAVRENILPTALAPRPAAAPAPRARQAPWFPCIVPNVFVFITIALLSFLLGLQFSNPAQSACMSTPSPTSMPTPEPTQNPTPAPTVPPSPVPTACGDRVDWCPPLASGFCGTYFCRTCTYAHICDGTCDFCIAPTHPPVPAPTALPTGVPIPSPSVAPIPVPTAVPVPAPTPRPSGEPTPEPTPLPSPVPTWFPTPDCPTGTYLYRVEVAALGGGSGWGGLTWEIFTTGTGGANTGAAVLSNSPGPGDAVSFHCLPDACYRFQVTGTPPAHQVQWKLREVTAPAETSVTITGTAATEARFCTSAAFLNNQPSPQPTLTTRPSPEPSAG